MSALYQPAPPLFQAEPAPVAPPSRPTMSLRPYQADAVDSIQERFALHDSTLAVMATGTGKTVVFAHLIDQTPSGRVMVLAHRQELIQQAADKIAQVTGQPPTVEMGEFWADTKRFERSRVVVSSIQTQVAGMQGKGRMTRFNPADFGLLIVDEAHHATADTYRRVIAHYRQNPNLKVLGVTATPDRADEEALGQVFESVAFEYPIHTAIEQGYLTPVMQSAVHVAGLDFSSVRTQAGDLHGAELASIMEYEHVLHAVATPTLEISRGRQTIVFAASVAHAQRLCEIFNRHKADCARFVHGGTPGQDRQEMFADYQARRFPILVNVGVVTEGTDVPGIEVVAMARPTKSRSLYAQMAGRAMRPLPGIIDHLDTHDQRREAISQSRKPHCIAEGQRVLTDCGLVPIERVTAQMKVWDGIEFVANSGIVFQGEREVISYAGLDATVDHHVWTAEGWKTLGQCAAQQTPISITGIGGTPVREAEGRYRGGRPSRATAPASPIDRVHRLRATCAEALRQCYGEQGRVSEVRQSRASAEVACAPGEPRATAVHEPEEHAFRGLRRTGHRVPLLVTVGDGAMGSGTLGASPEHDFGSDRQRRALRARKSSMGEGDGSTVESAEAANQRAIPRLQVGPPGSPLRRPNAPEDAGTRHDRRGDRRPLPHAIAQTKRRVWDILNAGPRHRFTVEGLLVSNCEIIDFVGNSGRHKLVCVADILGGKYTQEEIDLAAQATKEANAKGVPVDVAKQLELAHRKVESEKAEALRQKAMADERERRRREAIKAAATYKTQSVDPFDYYQVQPPKVVTWDKAPRPTDKQLEYLRRRGIDASRTTRGEAGRLIDQIGNKPTLKQANVLKRAGYSDAEVNGMDIKAASAAIDVLHANNWQRVEAKFAAAGLSAAGGAA